MGAKELVTSMLQKADVEIGGNRPGDIRVHDDRFYRRVLAQGPLGLGESYLDGWWDSDQLDEFFAKILSAKIAEKARISAGVMTARAVHALTNFQSRRQARHMADVHYNVSNEMFRAMLGDTLAYSCAYWRDAGDLDAAQRAKFDLICRKLELTERDHVLEIGCGWGSFARYAVDKYGCRVTGVTVADAQAAFAREQFKNDPVTIHAGDYRDIPHLMEGQKFSKLVSIGMYEHVGYRNYRTFAQIAHDALEDNGLFLLHTIGGHKSTRHSSDPWFAKYIFPGGMFPSIKQFGQSIEQLFVLEDLHNIGFHYSATLRAWYERFERFWQDPAQAAYRPQLNGSHERFYRMWVYYLLGASANFRVRGASVWQFVLSKSGEPGGYHVARRSADRAPSEKL